MTLHLLCSFVAAAFWPSAAFTSPDGCAVDLGGCPADAATREEVLDHSVLLQVSGHVDDSRGRDLGPKGDKKRPQMIVATWNLKRFDRATPSEIAVSLAQVGADVIGTNEDIEFNESSQDNALSIPGYTKAAACRGEALWESETAYALGGRWLQNAIYIRDETMTKVHSFSKNISDAQVVGEYVRCTAIADLQMKGGKKRNLPIRVAAAHLIGGQYVDSQFLTFEGEKAYEMRQVLLDRPDVLMGDLNSYPDTERVEQRQQAYDPYIDAKGAGQLDQYLGWTRQGTQEAEHAGYMRLQNFENTTAYGGTVDHIYLRPDVSLEFSQSFEVMGGHIVGNFEQSDHNLVMAGGSSSEA
eukprot:CAMPEP_0115675722 /NCGR_PEP_ID=MMETSP0272-20121206/54306_1 /TAXON_ID=71861 /ORGANISM="Scrippsiella trochoidea, Strain CCMP3099" /LENGTH=354 /DNA_ID=CAMNT_0003114717 /DNA_START=9 /DNA_END=1070 /DNA_ORIENTATION=+